MLLTGCFLALTACRESDDGPSSKNRVHDQKVHAVADAPAPEPLTAIYLIERVHRFYPRFKPFEESLEAFYGRADTAPETRSRWAAVRQGRTRDWSLLLSVLEKKLPGYRLWNPMPGPPISFNVCIAPENPGKTGVDKTLVFSVSHLAPLYFVYESHMRMYSDEPMRVFDAPTDAFPGVLDVVDRAIREHFGARRIDPELARLPVQDIQAGSLEIGEATVADALFDDDRM